MKAIAIIDMPETCDECPLRGFFFDSDYSINVLKIEHWTCKLKLGYANIKGKPRPDFCPLRPLPEKKWHEEGRENECEEWMKNGWNDCIDEITGETE